MSDTPQLSEAKRALLEKYLHGDLPQKAAAAHVITHHAEKEVADQRERGVPIQTGGSRRPFFFLHGHWQGTAFFCFTLARALGSDQPFYALEPYQFDGLSVPPTVEDMAAAHIKSMRAVQPEGPYLLGGWCNGGLVAYEMARQLHAAGQTVDLLVLMDAMYLGYCTRRRLLRWLISRLGKLMRRGPDEQLDWFLRLLYVCRHLQHAELLPYEYRRLRNALNGNSEESVRMIADKLISLVRRKVMASIRKVARRFEPGRRCDQGLAAVPHLDSLVPTAKALRQDYLGIFEWLDMGYKPSTLYPGKITFFWPRDGSWHVISGGWRKVIKVKGAQEVDVYIIPGGQGTWKTKYLYSLAEHLRTCLSKEQKEVT